MFGRGNQGSTRLLVLKGGRLHIGILIGVVPLKFIEYGVYGHMGILL